VEGRKDQIEIPQLQQNVQITEEEEEIPGSRDPDTVLKLGVYGNFEQVPVVFPPENANAEGLKLF
jgi:hypothetical protein